MANIPLKDIIITARQESTRMDHFYIGVEHLYVALLTIRGGLAARTLEQQGYTPEYVIDRIRRRIGKGIPERQWAGIPYTPRAHVVIGVANDLAADRGHESPNERDLLLAIIQERESIPMRLLKRLKIDMDKLHSDVLQMRTGTGTRPFLDVQFGPDFGTDNSLSEEHMFILRRMFYGYSHIRVDRQLTGGYTQARVLVVTPFNFDNRQDSAVVVKIDASDEILDEVERYDTYVRKSLPSVTARVEERPTAPDMFNLAGVKYTFVKSSDNNPHDLREVVGDFDPMRLGNWLFDELFPTFGHTWWKQNRPYRFQVAAEYDWLLPPVLILDYAAPETVDEDTHVIRVPVRRSRLKLIDYNEAVALEGFTVRRIYRDKGMIQLATGRGEDSINTHKILVRGMDFNKHLYYRGEIIERMVGHVWKTRSEILTMAVSALNPDFDYRAERIPADGKSATNLPNPLLKYEDLLNRHVNGTLSKLHGDLHLGNIMLGPGNIPCLIDFSHARDGHTLFDWANLEISLMAEVVAPQLGEDWEDLREAIPHLRAINGQARFAPTTDVYEKLAPIYGVRRVVEKLLATPNSWAEYMTALSMAAMRAITWETMPIGGRRLSYLIGALAMHELRSRHRTGSTTHDTSDDDPTRAEPHTTDTT